MLARKNLKPSLSEPHNKFLIRSNAFGQFPFRPAHLPFGPIGRVRPDTRAALNLLKVGLRSGRVGLGLGHRSPGPLLHLVD